MRSLSHKVECQSIFLSTFEFRWSEVNDFHLKKYDLLFFLKAYRTEFLAPKGQDIQIFDRLLHPEELASLSAECVWEVNILTLDFQTQGNRIA